MNFFKLAHICGTGWILKQSNLNQQAERKKIPCEFDRFLLVRIQFDRAIIPFYSWWTQSACVVCQCVRISITFITVASNAVRVSSTYTQLSGDIVFQRQHLMCETMIFSPIPWKLSPRVYSLCSICSNIRCHWQLLSMMQCNKQEILRHVIKINNPILWWDLLVIDPFQEEGQ